MIETVTTAAAAAVVRRYVEREAAARHHLVVYLSGAHAYGFPSPDSDFDLKCIHIQPTADLIGLVPNEGGAERIEMVQASADGGEAQGAPADAAAPPRLLIEVDYGSNELGMALRGALRGNGNFLERMLGELVLAEDTPRMATLRPLLRATLSKLSFRHYAGFQRSQLQAALAAQPPPAKKVLYALRTALTGVHLLLRGQIETDLSRLCDPYGFPAARELIEAKRAGERVALVDDVWARWRGELDRATAVLEDARRTSPLPDEPPDEAVAAVEAWLVAVRRESFG